MSLCNCPERARCDFAYGACDAAADWSVWNPWRRSFVFMCDGHLTAYRKAMTTRMPGIDRPPDAPDDWKGSLLDHIRHAEIAMAFEERNKRAQPANGDANRYTPAQLAQVYVLRRALREARQ